MKKTNRITLLSDMIRADERVCFAIEQGLEYSNEELKKMYEGLIETKGDSILEVIENAENDINKEINNVISACMEFEHIDTLINKNYKFSKQEIEDCKTVFTSYNINVENCKNEKELIKTVGTEFGLI